MVGERGGEGRRGRERVIPLPWFPRGCECGSRFDPDVRVSGICRVGRAEL